MIIAARPRERGPGDGRAGDVRRPHPGRQRGHPGGPRRPSARTRGSSTCGSRARSGGSRCRPPGTPTSRSRTSATSSSACGSATTASARRSRRRPGLRVVVHGRIDLYEPTGALQLYVDSMQPAGFGDLALRFEALKARLTAEGLFDAARKRPLPTRPTTIAVVTSPTGAVWRDVCTVLARRWPLVRVVLVAARVQGEDAPASIVTALGRVERWVASVPRRGPRGGCPGADHRGPWRRVDGGPLGVQRRAGRAGGRRPPDPGRRPASATRST